MLAAFPSEDHAEGVKDLDVTIPAQRSLGLSWKISTDTFTFHSPDCTKPLTRCGILSTVNSLYDPLGFAAPVAIHGRFLLKELSKGIDDWDEPEQKCREWEMWRNSLQDLEEIHVQRTYSLKSLSRAKTTEQWIFLDASFKAIGAVAYLKTSHEDGQISVGFILEKAKMTPPDEPTIPRLELCAAVLAVEISDLILDKIDFRPDSKISATAMSYWVTYTMKVRGFMCMSITVFKELDSHRRLSNGLMCLLSTIQLSVPLGLFQLLFLRTPCG